MEMAEALVLRGLEVTIVDRDDQVMPPLDTDMAAHVQTAAEGAGIRVLLSTELLEIRAGGFPPSGSGPAARPRARPRVQPVWSEHWGGPRWVDMLAGEILSLAADGSIHRRHVATVAAALRPRRGGGAVIATERGFALEDAGGALRPLPDVWTDPTVRMNEGGCDPQGRFYGGSMAYDQRPGAAALYRLDPDGLLRRHAHGGVDLFDYDPADGLTGRRALAELPEGPGTRTA